MAKVKVEMPEEFLRKLSLLGSKTDEIAGRVLEAGGEVVLAKVRSNLSSVMEAGQNMTPAPPVSWNAHWA